MKDTAIRKLYYSISEVSKLTGLEQYVLRYWETEFDKLSPSKNRAGNRIYTNRDIALILHIKKLLRDERYTIEGAKQVLNVWNPESDIPITFEETSVLNHAGAEEPPAVVQHDIALSGELQTTLREVKDLLLLLSEKLESQFLPSERSAAR